MSGNNLSVKVTADVTDLQTKFILAKAEVGGLTSEIGKLARAQAAGSLSILPGALQQMTGDLVAARTAAAAAGSALYQASGGMLGMAGAAAQGHGSISTATREFRALFDELSSGRTRQTPGTLAIIAQRVLGLGPAALGAAAGVLGLVGGLAYLAVRAIEAARAIGQIDISSSFAGNLDITTSSVMRYAATLSQASNISSSEARKIIASFAAVPGMTNAALATLTQTMSEFAQETGQDADKAAESLSKLFASDVSAGDFAKKLSAVTQLSQEQLNSASAADRSGNASQVMAEKLSLLNQAVTAASPALKSYNSSVDSSVKNMAAFTAMISAGMTTEEANAQLFGTEAAAIDKAAAARKNLIAIVQSQPPSSEQTLKTGVSAAEGENPISQQITQANAKINEMTAALTVAQQRADQVDIDKLNAGLEKARQNLAELQFGPILEQMRSQMEQVAATWDGTQSGMLSKQIQVGEAALAEVQKNSKEALAIQTEVSRLEVQQKQAAGTESIASAREQISQIGMAERQGAMERLEAEKQVWQQVLAGDQLTAAQRVEVERSLNQTIAGITREGAAEKQTIARQDAAADISIARLQIEAAKNAIDLSAAADKAAADQKLARLRQLTATEFSINEQALEAELANLAQQPAAYDQVYNQIKELKAKLVVDLEALDRQYNAQVAKDTKEQASQWHSAVGEIENAEGGMVSDLLNKRKSLSQSLLQVGAELVTKEIANDLRAVTTRLLLNKEGDAAQKALEQGGFLYHAAVQLQGTAATATSQTAQTAATATGNAARTASTAAAATTSKAAGAAAGGSTVMADAAKAFSGTYASVAQIPYVGWIMAPVAAASAFAAVAAYEGLASLDVGTNYVPHDMTARIHQGEAVVPKAFNPAAGGSMPMGGGNLSLHMPINAMDGASVHRVVNSSAFHDAIKSAAGRYMNRGGRI
jgi:hypothetical protein